MLHGLYMQTRRDIHRHSLTFRRLCGVKTKRLSYYYYYYCYFIFFSEALVRSEACHELRTGLGRIKCTQ